MPAIKIDLDTANPTEDKATRVEDMIVVFVPQKDGELRINQTTKIYHKGRPIKVTRDEARILLEADQGYVRE